MMTRTSPNLRGLVFLLLCLLVGGLSAQNPFSRRTDSLALLEIYNATRGANWTNSQTGAQPWTANSPITSWLGVQVDPQLNRVTGLSLPNNNLQDSLPRDIEDLDQLTSLNLAGNEIEFLPQLKSMDSLDLIDVRNNRLSIEGLRNFRGLHSGPVLNQTYLYTPQKRIDKSYTYAIYPNDTLIMANVLDASIRGIEIVWYKGSSQNPLPTSNNPAIYTLFGNDTTVADSYYYQTTDPDFPGLILRSNNRVVNKYEFPNPFPDGPLSFIFRFEDTDTEAFKIATRAVLDSLGGRLLDSCLCGFIEVWEFDSIGDGYNTNLDPNTDIIGGGAVKLPPRTGGGSTAEYYVNYGLRLGDDLLPSPNSWIDLNGLDQSSIVLDATNPVKVGVIDLGIDANHPAFQGKLYVDNSPGKGKDACYTGDPSGYNFHNGSDGPFNDITGHGSHVANIIVSTLPMVPIEIMSLQVGDAANTSTVFKAICAVEYALRHEVDVINISMGYYGEEVELFTEVLTKNPEVYIVTAAGNDERDTDVVPYHWPSHLAKDHVNIFSVGSYGIKSGGGYQVSPHSNIGDETVTLAAPGENIFSAVNGGGYDTKTGTSMAVGFVSSFLAAAKAGSTPIAPVDILERMRNQNIVIQDIGLNGDIMANQRLNLEIIDCSKQPIAQDDIVELGLFEFSLGIDVLINDCYDPSTQKPSNLSTTGSSNLALNGSNGLVDYSPGLLFLILGGEDSFTYDLCDSSNAVCSTATVIVT
ncbi:MAG: S8 family serine peptidase, partial [Bacteroidota bacterium]